MTDERRIKQFAKALGLRTYAFTKAEFICEKARAEGAVKSIIIEYGKPTRMADLNFEIDSKGNCIGFSTDSANSFARRARGKTS